MISKIAAAVLPCVALGADNLFSVSTGRSTSFYVEKGNAKAAGRNQFGQLGLRNEIDLTEFSDIFVRDDSQVLVKQIAAGAFHTIIVADTGDVYVTGRNHKGQLGRSGQQTSGGAWERPLLGNVKEVAAGYAHSVFLMEDGTVKASGWNRYGQLGDNSTDDKQEPVPVPPFVAGMSPDRALVETLYGNGTQNGTQAPTPAPHPKATAIAAGYDFTYILEDNGDVWVVGNNLGGQLGFDDGKGRNHTEVVLSGVEAIAAGESHGLFLMAGRKQVFATGANFAGQLGDGTFDKRFTPVEVRSLSTPHAVAAAGDGSCIAELKLRCSGSNILGQLGLREDKFIEFSESVEEVPIADSMAPGETHSLFLNHDEVFVTGRNFFGELGNNDTTQQISTPRLLTTLESRGDLTTTMPTTAAPSPPSPSPGPGPTPPGGETPSPAPSPGRDTQGDRGLFEGWPWQMLVAGIACGLGVVCIVMCIMDRAEASGSSGQDGLELGQQQEAPSVVV